MASDKIIAKKEELVGGVLSKMKEASSTIVIE